MRMFGLRIRVTMTFRISQVAVVCGLGLLALPGVVQAQAPRYQSPLSAPNAPQPQITLPVTPAIAISSRAGANAGQMRIGSV